MCVSLWGDGGDARRGGRGPEGGGGEGGGMGPPPHSSPLLQSTKT